MLTVVNAIGNRVRTHPDSPDGMCIHCKMRYAFKSRGLCYTCYYTGWVRNLYKPPDTADKFRKKGPLSYNTAHSLPLPPEPTDAEPGSDEKLRVMEWRAENGYSLHHPDDATHDSSQEPRSRGLLLVG